MSNGQKTHLSATSEWLKRAHDMSSDDGVSYGYSIWRGWRPSYRETSGYIATTFFDLAHYYDTDDYRERALRISQWLLNVQNEDGSFANPRYGDEGIVFDTGQDLFGLVRAYEEKKDEAFKEGANRAAEWLVQVANQEGHWNHFEHLNTPHAYNTRTSWALLRMNQLEYIPEREWIARANLDWAILQQQNNGFFDNCAFVKGTTPFTHNIAYTTRGLLESGTIIDDNSYTVAAIKCAQAVISLLHEDGFLPGRITIDGEAAANYCCLTGNCQFAIIWMKLFEREHNIMYMDAATKALDYVIDRQDINITNLDVRGAIKGSDPIWGGYSPLTFPNWAAKFFVDAMLLRDKLG